MAIQLGALREALLDAGATPEKAGKAAEELASYEGRLANIDIRLERVEGGQPLVQGMLGVNLVLTAGVLWRLLAMH